MKYVLISASEVNQYVDYVWGEYVTFQDAYEDMLKLEKEIDNLRIESKKMG